MQKYKLILLFIAAVFMTFAVEPQTRVSPKAAPSSAPVPSASFFSGIPIHLIGETVNSDGYQVSLTAAQLQGDEITLSVEISNLGSQPIDLNWGVQLYQPDEAQLSLKNPLPDGEALLQPGDSLRRDWVFTNPLPDLDPQTLTNYRFVFAPRGWSGPVVIYRLSDQAPQPQPPTAPPPEPPEAGISAYGVTGDPWKMLVLIYRNIDTDYVEDGVQKHLTASMPEADITNMRNSFLNIPHRNVVYGYSDNLAEVEAHVVIVDRPLTNLEPISTGFWPSPSVTKPELDLYAPKGKYDSVIVFWQASHPTTGQSLPIYGWGLGYWPGDYANGMTYATVFNLSWYWPGDPCRGEVFLHEWLHGVTGYYMWLGYPFPVEDLHGAEEAGYTTNANGCWETWLRDYMRGRVLENSQYKGLVPATWQGGSITTRTINGWRGEYFNNETLTGIPALVRGDTAINFDWAAESPHPLVNADHFSARWTRTLNFSAGTYEFSALRDDGARLWIDNVMVIDAWQYGRQWETVRVPLTAGNHTLRYEMYEIDGWSAAILNWQLAPVQKPLNLTASPEENAVLLTWDNQETDSEVLVERSPTGSSQWVQIAKTSLNAVSFRDTNVECGQTYYYRVRALKTSQYSPYSSTASAGLENCIVGTCKPARTLLLGKIHAGSTARASASDSIDYYRGVPWDETGPEVAYTFYTHSSGTVEFLLEGLLADLDVIILDDAGSGCDPNEVLSYGDTSASINAQAGHTYHVVVDGAYGAAGAYKLRARALSFMPGHTETALSLRPTLAVPEIGARSYTLQLSRYADFHKLMVSKTLLRPAWTPSSNLLPATEYFWRVKVKMPDGSSQLMGPYQFTTPNPPGKSALLLPTSGSKKVSRLPFLQWAYPTLAPGTTFGFYEVQIATDSSFHNPVRIVVVDDFYHAYTQLSTALSPLTRHYWRVRSFTDQGEFGPWSSVRNFRTGE